MKYVNKFSMLLALCLCSFTLLAQTTLKGKVTDGKEAVIGANVTIKGTTPTVLNNVDIDPFVIGLGIGVKL